MNPPQNNIQTQSPVRYIILDTNILIYAENKDIVAELLKFLLELTQRGFGLAISDISIYESLRERTVGQEVEIINTLKLFPNYLITNEVLIASSRLSTLYKNEGVPINQIEIPDKIIASTAILTNSLILTANINDFPRPFFSEAEKKYILYKKRNKEQLLVVMLLQPDPVVIQDRFAKRP